MTDWNMRTEDLELKDGSIVNNYHYEFNTTDNMFAKIMEDVLKIVIDIAREKLAEHTEPRRGEWIDISEWYTPRHKCSICKTIVDGYGSNFCSNCGADMRR